MNNGSNRNDIEVFDCTENINNVDGLLIEGKESRKKKSLLGRFRKSFKRLSCTSGNKEDLKDKYSNAKQPFVKPRGYNKDLEQKLITHSETDELIPEQQKRPENKNGSQFNGHQNASNGHQNVSTGHHTSNGHQNVSNGHQNASNGHYLPSKRDNQVSVQGFQNNLHIERDGQLKSRFFSQPGPQNVNQYMPVYKETVSAQHHQQTYQIQPNNMFGGISSSEQEYNRRLMKESNPHQLPSRHIESFNRSRTVQFHVQPPVSNRNERTYINTKPDLENEYDFSHKKRGIAVLIIMTNFRDQPMRHFARNDRDRMSEILIKLGFDIEVIEDETSQNIMNKLKEIRYRMTSRDYDFDCFTCVISSHGEEIPSARVHEMPNVKLREHAIFTFDGVIALREILELFDDGARLENGKLFRALKGKPKLFFIQACRAIMGKSNEECLDRGIDIEVVFGSPRELQHRSTSHEDGPNKSNTDEQIDSATQSSNRVGQDQSNSDEKIDSSTHRASIDDVVISDTVDKMDISQPCSSTDGEAQLNPNETGVVVQKSVVVSQKTEFEDSDSSKNVAHIDRSQTNVDSTEPYIHIDRSQSNVDSTERYLHTGGSLNITDENIDSQITNKESHMDARYKFDPVSNSYCVVPDVTQPSLSRRNVYDYTSASNTQNIVQVSDPHSVIRNPSMQVQNQMMFQGDIRTIEQGKSVQSCIQSNNPPNRTTRIIGPHGHVYGQNQTMFSNYNENSWYPAPNIGSINNPNSTVTLQNKRTEEDLNQWLEDTLKSIDDASSVSKGNDLRNFPQQQKKFTQLTDTQTGYATKTSDAHNTNQRLFQNNAAIVPKWQENEKEKVEFCEIPCGNDFLIMYTAPSGQIGWSTGDKENPTVHDIAGWLPYCLYSIIDSAWTSKTLLEVLTDANALMVREMEANMKYKSVSCIEHRMLKDVIFRKKN